MRIYKCNITLVGEEDRKVSLDLKALSKELEEVCAELNLTADISEKKKKPEDDIPIVATGKSQSFESFYGR